MEINFIRAVLILLVILIHLTPFKDHYPEAQNAILAFVTPLFLFITGYLFNINKSAKQYAVYLSSLLAMYIMFEVAYAVSSYFFPVRDGLEELSVAAVLVKLLLNPIGPYWYLYTMIKCGTIYYVVHRICCHYRASCDIALSVLVSLLLSYYSPLLGLMPPLAYFAGVVFRRHADTCGSPFNGSFVLILVAIVTLIYGIVSNPGYASQLSYYSILLSVCTIESLVWCAQRIPPRVCRVISFVGANTLPIFLFHPVFTLVLKHLLRGVIDRGYLSSFIILTVVVAAIGSLLVGYALDVLGLSVLLFRRRMLR